MANHVDPPGPSGSIHPTAEVSPDARVGTGTRIWRHAHVREYASIGEDCIIGQGVYIDVGVQTGSRVKIGNNASVYQGVTIADGVFVGPHVCFTNDLFPRAITVDGMLKGPADWEITSTRVEYGASIGAGSVIRCGVTIGAFALVGAGSVVTKDVPPHALAFGAPASVRDYVCRCARPLDDVGERDGTLSGWCAACGQLCVIGPPVSHTPHY